MEGWYILKANSRKDWLGILDGLTTVEAVRSIKLFDQDYAASLIFDDNSSVKLSKQRRIIIQAIADFIRLDDQIILGVMGSLARGETAPFSDCDLLIINDTPHSAEPLLQFLWDVGWQTAHRMHSSEALMQVTLDDHQTLTAILESTFVWGRRDVFLQLYQKFVDHVITPIKQDFVNAKILETQKRHQKYDPQGTLEPDLKHTAGGIRDANLLHWLELCGHTHSDITKSIQILTRYRYLLQHLLQKPINRLDFHSQKQLEETFFPKNFADNQPSMVMLQIHTAMERINIAATKAITVSHHKPDKNCHAVQDYINKITATDLDGSCFRKILQSPNAQTTLTALTQTGCLQHALPPFAHIDKLMQYDQTHLFTAGQHTIRTVGYCHQFNTKQTPLAARLLKQVSLDMLTLAAFFHDIGKGYKTDHSEKGADIVAQYQDWLGLSAHESDLLQWLIRHHLMLTNAAFRHDADNPDLIKHLCDDIQSMERLRLLLLLSVVDMQGTNPKLLTPWKATLLRGLYAAIEERLSGGMITQPNSTRITQAKLDAELAIGGTVPDLPDAFWLSSSRKHWHWLLAKLHTDADIQIDYYIDHGRGITDFAIQAPDIPGLFSRITSVFSTAKANVREAKLFSLNNNRALDIISIEHLGTQFTWPDQLDRLSQKLYDIIGQDIPKTRTKATLETQSIQIDNDSLPNVTVVEVIGADLRGLLYTYAHIFYTLGFSIKFAKIATFENRAIDVFYVTNNNDKQLNAAEIQKLHQKLVGKQ